MDDGGKTREDLLGDVQELRGRLAAAERDCQIMVESLKDERRVVEAQWQQRVENLEADLARYTSGAHPPLAGFPSRSGGEDDDCERQGLLVMVQSQAEELQAANEELTIQSEELRITNEELVAQAEILEHQNQELEHLSGQLETERALLNSVLEQMPASVVIVAAPQGPILLSNHRAEEIWDLGSHTDLGSFWRIPRYHPDGRVYQKEEMPLWRSLTVGEVVLDEEFSLRPQGGRPIHLSVSSAPVRDRQGRIVAGVVTHSDITPRKRTEQTLRESEERYRSLFQDSHGVMLLIDPENGAIVDANSAACSYYGYSKEELTAKVIMDINLLPADRVMAGMQKARSGESGQFLFQHRLADGRMRDVEVFSGPIHFHGKILLYSIVQDITARKVAELERQKFLERLQESQEELQAINEELQAQTEELQKANQDLLTAQTALRESEARFRGVFESMTEGVVLHEIIYDGKNRAADYRIVATNPAFAVHTGLQPEQIQGKLASIVFGGGEAPYLETYARVAQTGEPAAFETFFPPLQRHFYISATSPKPGQFITVFEDITERKQMEEALRHSNQRLDLLAETAGQLLASDFPQQVVDSLCHKVMKFLDCDAFFNFLVDEKQGRLHLNACAGIPSEEAKRIEWLDYGVAVCGCAARDGRRIIAEEIQTTSDPRTEMIKPLGIRAFACHPLLRRDRVLGTLAFGTRTRDRFSADDLALMKAVADQVAVAMERKLAEEALIRAKEEWERTFDAVPDSIALLDKAHHITRMNRAMAELMGKAEEEVIGQPCYKAVHGLDEAPDFCPHSRVVASGLDHSTEVEEFGRTFAVSVSPIFGPNGQLLGGVHVARDITEHKEAEEALKRAHDELEQRVKERTTELRDTVAQLIEEVQERQQAQESLRKQAGLLELAHEAIIVKDLDSRVTFWSRGAAETYGWTREQAIGQVIHVMLKTQFPTSLEEVHQELLQRGQWEGELVHTRADGKEITVASRMALQRDDQDQPVAILEINRDVTARRQAEEALKTERQRLFAVLERIPAHVALLRPDYTFAYANGEFIRRFGEPGSKRCYEVVGQQNPCAECQAMEVFYSKQPVIREWAGADGSLYQMYDYPFTDVDGSPLVLEMGVDITGRKRAEDQALSLGRMYRMLSKVNEAIVRVSNQDELFRQICRLMMEEGNFLLAWIGLVDPEARLVKAATQYDLKDEYVQNITIPFDDVPEGRGPTGTAVREGRYDVCNDIAADPRMAPWREPALARGFRSSAAFPLRVGSHVVGALTVYADRPGFFTADEIGLLGSLSDDISFALDFMGQEAKRRRAEESLRESEEGLRYLASQLLHAQERERRRLALELHDDLGQSLMVLKLQLRAIERTVPSDQWKTREECAHSLGYLNGVIQNVRRLARNLRPSVLEDLGLSAGLRVLTEEFRAYHEIDMSLEMDNIDGLFSRDDEINIYRIFQETLTNIAKHAHARRVNLSITRQADSVTFRVVDDGVGFDLEQVLARDPGKKGLGLAALEERVRMLGGTQTIRTQENQGTEVSFIVPVTKDGYE
jgi:PAS domain S-box-containing protein